MLAKVTMRSPRRRANVIKFVLLLECNEMSVGKELRMAHLWLIALHLMLRSRLLILLRMIEHLLSLVAMTLLCIICACQW